MMIVVVGGRAGTGNDTSRTEMMVGLAAAGGGKCKGITSYSLCLYAKAVGGCLLTGRPARPRNVHAGEVWSRRLAPYTPWKRR